MNIELEYQVDDDKVDIVLPDRVNESNAEPIKKQMLAIINLHKDKTPAIDCKKLKFISSSGLRAILTVQKRRGSEKVTLKNVSREVYEILEMTGFDEIFHVSRVVKKLSIEGCKKIASSINGAFYKLDKGMMVKVFRESMTLEEAEKEMEMARKALICGVPTPISFTIVKCGDCYGIIFENIEPVSIAQLIHDNPAKLGYYTLLYTNFVKELHEKEIMPGELPSIKSRYMEWLEEAEQKLPAEMVVGMKEMVKCMDEGSTFVHGDLTLNNVYMANNELMVMDLSSCGYGHPIYDLQAIYASLVAIEIDNPGYCERTMGLTGRQCKQIWKLFMNRYLAGEDETPNETQQKTLNRLLTQYYILKEQLVDGMKE